MLPFSRYLKVSNNMSESFCLELKKEAGNFVASFESSDGEQYVIRYEIGNSNSNLRNSYSLKRALILEWKNRSNKFIKFSFYNTNNSQTSYDKVLRVNNDNECLIQCSQEYDVVFITVAASLHLIEREAYLRSTKPSNQSTTTAKKEPVVGKKLEQLSADIKNLRQTGHLSDIVLTDGSKEIGAHKLILSARSSVFAKMLQHPMKENLDNRITIKDVSIEVLGELLNFMYTGTVTIKDSKMARDLYVASDKYDIGDLKGICVGMLKSVNLDDVLDTLLLSDLYGDKLLKEASLTFISKHYSQVKSLQKWNAFMKSHQNLAIEILSFVIDKKM